MKWLLACIVLGLASLLTLVVAWDHYDKYQEAQSKMEELNRDLRKFEADHGMSAPSSETHRTWTWLYQKHLAARTSHLRRMFATGLGVPLLALGAVFSAVKYRRVRAAAL